jgi:protein-S-isoprenylcysteine O-methyltransferase Ste14
MLGMLIGTAFVSGEAHALIAAVVLAIACTRKIRQEETLLLEIFGPQDEEYRRESRALIPGFL